MPLNSYQYFRNVMYNKEREQSDTIEMYNKVREQNDTIVMYNKVREQNDTITCWNTIVHTFDKVNSRRTSTLRTVTHV